MVYTLGWVGGNYKYVQKYIVGWADLLPLSTPAADRGPQVLYTVRWVGGK